MVRTGPSFAGVRVQRLISAANFLVLVSINKSGVIEVFIMGTKSLTSLQIFGVPVVTSAGSQTAGQEELGRDGVERQRGAGTDVDGCRTDSYGTIERGAVSEWQTRPTS